MAEKTGSLRFSFKVFVIVLLTNCCSAQPIQLPQEFSDDIINQMTQHFSCDGGSSENNCGQTITPRDLCKQILILKDCRSRCWNKDITCRNGQTLVCGYDDAVACRYTNSRRFCVYHQSDEILPFCICKDGHVQTSCNEDGPNVAAIVLGCILSLLLLLVIIGVVVWYLRRKGKLPAFMKNASKLRDSSGVELDERGTTRPQLPEPLVTGGIPEYSYAYDHLPRAQPGMGDHTYSSIENEDAGEGSARYVKEGPGRALSDEKSPNKEDPNDHQYFVLEKTPGQNNGVNNEDRGTTEVPTEMSDSSAGVPSTDPSGGTPSTDPQAELPSKEGEDHTYFPLIPTAEPPEGKSKNDNAGYEVAEVPTAADGSDASSPYDHFDRNKGSSEGAFSDKDDNEYQHLKDN